MNPVPRILIVDDSTEYSELFSLILRQAGFEVDAVYDPTSGFRKARSEVFDVVLLDNNFETSAIPGMSIIAVLKNQSKAKVIMLTSSNDQRKEHEAKALGVDAFLTKPVEASKLLATIDKLLGRAPQKP